MVFAASSSNASAQPAWARVGVGGRSLSAPPLCRADQQVWCWGSTHSSLAPAHSYELFPHWSTYRFARGGGLVLTRSVAGDGGRNGSQLVACTVPCTPVWLHQQVWICVFRDCADAGPVGACVQRVWFWLHGYGVQRRHWVWAPLIQQAAHLWMHSEVVQCEVDPEASLAGLNQHQHLSFSTGAVKFSYIRNTNQPREGDPGQPRGHGKQFQIAEKL